MKPFFTGLFLNLLLIGGATGQTISGGNGGGPGSGAGLFDGAASPTPAPEKKKGDANTAPAGPTVIDSQNMDYDEKTRVAVFTGEDYGVFLKDPQFTVNCDKLTAYMRKVAGGAGGAAGVKGKGAAVAKATPAPAAKPGGADAAAPKGNGLQRAIAEGSADRPVVIVQDKPAANGDEAQHNVGIAEKADYNADTGDVILTGWPRVSQGINTQIATSKNTVMTMNKDGHTMTTRGSSRSIIQEQAQPKKSGSDAGSTDETPAPTPAP